MLVVALGFVLSGIFILWISSFKMPDLSGLEQRKISQSTKIFDRTGQVLLYDVHQDVRRTIVSFDQISRNIKNAAVAIEDAEFYQHKGIKLSSFIRAVLTNIGTFSFSQGGSTITQQVVKNIILTKEKSISRKLKEWVLSVKLEQLISKEEILTLYLNESPYGGNMYGIQEASQSYFGKNAADVTLAESAYLAAIPNAPTYYSPYGTHLDKLEERKNLVLARMLENKFITQEEYDTAKQEKVAFKPQAQTGIYAPHFVLYVKEYLESKYGPRAISDGGMKVITTLDYQMQEKAEEIARRHAEETEKKFNAENAGLIAIDIKTGQILSMVGSRNYFDKEIDGNYNVTLAKRQPGSSFKPFVYATAFKKGYTPETTLFNLRTEFSTYCNPDGTPINSSDEDKCYMPENYDGRYEGPMTLRNALAQSVNIIAIKVLYLAGIRDSLQTARDLGITTLGDINQYGLTLVLGGGEVTLLEMTSAYATLANGGVRNPHTAIIEITDQNGNVLEKYDPHPTTILPKKVTLEISDILSDEKARAPEFGSHSLLYFPEREVAVKTGTTNDYRDAWIVGYTPSVAVGAWAGNNDNSSMEKKIAGFIIAPLWHEFMDTVLASSSPNERFERPEETDMTNLKPVLRGLWQGNIAYTIDRMSGKLATSFTPPETRVEKVVQDVHSILYWVDKNNPLGPSPEHPENDSQFPYWEYAVQKWVAQQNLVAETPAVIPTATDDIHTPSLSPQLNISGIDQNTLYQVNSSLYVSVVGFGKYPLTKVDFFLNDQFIGSSSHAPFGITFTPNSIGQVNDINTLKVVGYDSVFNKSEAVVGLRLLFENQ